MIPHNLSSCLILAIAFCWHARAEEGRAQSPPQEFKNWTVFLHTDPNQITQADLTQIPKTLPGKRRYFVFPNPISPLPLTMSNSTINLADKGYSKTENEFAIFYTTLASPADTAIQVGAAADWWMKWYVNGDLVYETPNGNESHLFETSDHAFSIPLKAGKNVIAVKVFSGSKGWRLVADINPPVKAGEPLKEESFADLETKLRKVLEETHTPGAGIAIVSKDKVLWVTGLGKADLAANKDVTPDTLFRIGSISKGFAALSILKLVEQGKLSLNDTVRSLVPEIQFQNRWEATDPVRVVHLLEHTTGFDDMAPKDYANNDPKPLTLKEGLDFNPATRVSRWRPGSRYAYCNSGPPIAAYIVEKITGRRFEDYVKENFFLPLHMDSASYLLTPEVDAKLTKAYMSYSTNTVPYWHILERPAGAINASPREMANYVRMYLNRGSLDGTKLLEPSSIDRMETPATTPAARMGMTSGYGLCNYASFSNGFLSHGHDGAVSGALAHLSYLRDQGLGCVVMINSDSWALGRLVELVSAHITRNLPKPSPPPIAGIPPAIASQYAGIYEPISPRVEMNHFAERLLGLCDVSFRDGHLVAKGLLGGSAQEFVAVSDRLYRKTSESAATLALLPDQGEGILFEDVTETFRRVPAWYVALELCLAAASFLLMASSPLFALVWIPRKVFGRMKGVRHLSLRIAPLLSTVFFILTVVIFIKASGRYDIQNHLGHLTVYSGGIFLSTLAFALTAFWGLYLLVRVPRKEVNSFAWWHCLLIITAVMIVTGYLTWWGIIGLRTWA